MVIRGLTSEFLGKMSPPESAAAQPKLRRTLNTKCSSSRRSKAVVSLQFVAGDSKITVLKNELKTTEDVLNCRRKWRKLRLALFRGKAVAGVCYGLLNYESSLHPGFVGHCDSLPGSTEKLTQEAKRATWCHLMPLDRSKWRKNVPLLASSGGENCHLNASMRMPCPQIWLGVHLQLHWPALQFRNSLPSRRSFVVPLIAYVT